MDKGYPVILMLLKIYFSLSLSQPNSTTPTLDLISCLDYSSPLWFCSLCNAPPISIYFTMRTQCSGYSLIWMNDSDAIDFTASGSDWIDILLK